VVEQKVVVDAPNKKKTQVKMGAYGFLDIQLSVAVRQIIF